MTVLDFLLFGFLFAPSRLRAYQLMEKFQSRGVPHQVRDDGEEPVGACLQANGLPRPQFAGKARSHRQSVSRFCFASAALRLFFKGPGERGQELVMPRLRFFFAALRKRLLVVGFPEPRIPNPTTGFSFLRVPSPRRAFASILQH